MPRIDAKIYDALAAVTAEAEGIRKARIRLVETMRAAQATGASLREIGCAAGLSHSRIHQLLNEEPPPPKRRSPLAERFRKDQSYDCSFLSSRLLWSVAEALNSTHRMCKLQLHG